MWCIMHGLGAFVQNVERSLYFKYILRRRCHATLIISLGIARLVIIGRLRQRYLMLSA